MCFALGRAHSLFVLVLFIAVVPSLARIGVADSQWQSGLASLRFLYLQGEVLPCATVRQLYSKLYGSSSASPSANGGRLGVRLLNVYGTWECVNITYAEMHRLNLGTVCPVDQQYAPVGYAMPNVIMYVLRQVEGEGKGTEEERSSLDWQWESVPVGEKGEVFFASPGASMHVA